MFKRKIRNYQADPCNTDLFDIYQDKMVAMSKKHFSKDLKDVQSKLQSVVNWLEKE